MIYKKDSAGNIRYLSITAKENMVVQESGILNTSSPVFNSSYCEGKNIGKVNETSPEEQAILEANSKITEKRRLGYFDTIEEAKKFGGKDFLLPMLAKDYKKEKSKVKFPCFVQPKLDGMRALASEENGFTSRTGKKIDTLNHIVLTNFDDYILDGEVYAHGISFQENMKLIKKYRKGQTEQVKYHVYDIVMNTSFLKRQNILAKLIYSLNNPNIELVPSKVVNNEEEIKHWHTIFISQGYEGTIIRHSEEGYTINKRSSQLLKYKDFLDETYTVIDVIPSEARPEQGIIVCKMNPEGMSMGGIFNCGMKFSHADREEILANKENYIGRSAEVRFFEFTDGGLPRFPVCIGFRSTFEK